MTQLKNSENESLLVEKFFNKQWKIYQKVLNNNYMGHNEIYAILHFTVLQFDFFLSLFACFCWVLKE